MRVRAATLIAVALTACRINFDPTNEGQGGDAALEDAGPGTVTVTVHGKQYDDDNGMPVANADVVFVAADGTETATRTDATGFASAFVTGSTTVHVAYPTTELGAPGWRISSFTNVGGGSDIRVGDRDTNVATPNSADVTFPPLAGATRYAVGTLSSCHLGPISTDETTFALAFTDACEGQVVPLYAVGFDDTGLIGYIELGNVTLVDGGTLTPNGVWQAPIARPVRVLNAPAALGIQIIGARRSPPMFVCGALTNATGTVELSCDGRDPEPEQLTVYAIVDMMTISALSVPFDAVTPSTIDAADLVPAAENIMVDEPTVGIQWEPPASGVTATLALRDWDADNQQIQWFYYVPPGRSSSTIADLPASLASLIPTTATGLSGSIYTVRLGALSYRDVVQRIEPELAMYFDRANINIAFTLRTAQGTR